MRDSREFIAKNTAALLNDGELINLGVGIPISVPQYIPDNIHIMVHAEAGVIGCGKHAAPGDGDKYLIDAAGKETTLVPGGCCVDSALSFGLVRGGHLDTTILGALQVDACGDMANWMIPGKRAIGMGGAMDLSLCAKRVIVTMEHFSDINGSKLLKRCTLPITCAGKVDIVVTELAILQIQEDRFVLTAIAPGVTIDKVREKTQANIEIAPTIGLMLEV